jgi:hypothetical protein
MLKELPLETCLEELKFYTLFKDRYMELVTFTLEICYYKNDNVAAQYFEDMDQSTKELCLDFIKSLL